MKPLDITNSSASDLQLREVLLKLAEYTKTRSYSDRWSEDPNEREEDYRRMFEHIDRCASLSYPEHSIEDAYDFEDACKGAFEHVSHCAELLGGTALYLPYWEVGLLAIRWEGGPEYWACGENPLGLITPDWIELEIDTPQGMVVVDKRTSITAEK